MRPIATVSLCWPGLRCCGPIESRQTGLATRPRPVQWIYIMHLNPTLFLSDAVWTLGLNAAALGALIAIFSVWYSPVMNRRFGKTWVKALDSPYLTLAFLGLVRAVVNASPIVGEERSTILIEKPSLPSHLRLVSAYQKRSSRCFLTIGSDLRSPKNEVSDICHFGGT